MKYIVMDFKDGDFSPMNLTPKKKSCKKQESNGDS